MWHQNRESLSNRPLSWIERLRPRLRFCNWVRLAWWLDGYLFDDRLRCFHECLFFFSVEHTVHQSLVGHRKYIIKCSSDFFCLKSFFSFQTLLFVDTTLLFCFFYVQERLSLTTSKTRLKKILKHGACYVFFTDMLCACVSVLVRVFEKGKLCIGGACCPNNTHFAGELLYSISDAPLFFFSIFFFWRPCLSQKKSGKKRADFFFRVNAALP